MTVYLLNDCDNEDIKNLVVNVTKPKYYFHIDFNSSVDFHYVSKYATAPDVMIRYKIELRPTKNSDVNMVTYSGTFNWKSTSNPASFEIPAEWTTVPQNIKLYLHNADYSKNGFNIKSPFGYAGQAAAGATSTCSSAMYYQTVSSTYLMPSIPQKGFVSFIQGTTKQEYIEIFNYDLPSSLIGAYPSIKDIYCEETCSLTPCPTTY